MSLEYERATLAIWQSLLRLDLCDWLRPPGFRPDRARRLPPSRHAGAGRRAGAREDLRRAVEPDLLLELPEAPHRAPDAAEGSPPAVGARSGPRTPHHARAGRHPRAGAADDG